MYLISAVQKSDSVIHVYIYIFFFIFLGSKIISDSNYSHELKRCLLLGRKAMINLDSILRNRDITLPAEIHKVKAMILTVVIH